MGIKGAPRRLRVGSKELHEALKQDFDVLMEGEEMGTKRTQVEEPDEGTPGKRGGPVQWAYHGHGFAPAGKTVPSLQAGVYHLEWINNTLCVVPQHLTTDNLVRLPDSQSDFVINEIERFWEVKDIFDKLGFAHKRGFLLHGPPGSGKTSTVAIAIEKMVARGGIVLLMGTDDPGQWSQMMLKFRQIEPDRKAVVILEDIDAIIEEHSESSVLSLLDGENSIDNVVFIATTNFPKDLDGRLTNRPSRFDWVIEIGPPSAEGRREYLLSRNIPGLDVGLWVKMTDGFSIAHLKELIVRVIAYERNLEEEVTRLRAMKTPPKNFDDAKGGAGFSVSRDD